MEPSRTTSGAADLKELGHAAREFLRENPPGGIEVPAHPAVRLAAGACDFVVGLFLSLALSCPLSWLVTSVVGATPEGLLAKSLFLSLASLAAAAYTLPEAYGSPTLAKSWFRFRLSTTRPGTARRALRRRWLLKASPWLMLAAVWAGGVVRVATGEPPNFVDRHWVRDLDQRATVLAAAAVVLLMFVPCFGPTRQALYDRAGGALVVRKVPLRQQRGHGFEVIPTATLAQAPPVSARPGGLEASGEDGYLPSADDD